MFCILNVSDINKKVKINKINVLFYFSKFQCIHILKSYFYLKWELIPKLN